ncbi:MAG TPA: alpha-amylase family glycosyl hydrolase [Candidatus Limnocylindrales bacterium]|nr:alpha-amylase family glycosyl hydrolase [Candidatus Limnocylindrales bacterium]
MRALPRLGSWLSNDGATFDVWAPNASDVSVNLRTSLRTVSMASLSGGYWHAEIPGVLAGEHYQYAIENAGTLLAPRVDPYAREIDAIAGDRQSVVYDEAAFDWESSNHRPPSPNDLVICEIHVGTFNELPGQQVGTLADAAIKLPYLAGLGINAVELLPPAEFGGTLSWGYNPTNPFAVETSYGGPHALKSFIRSAHRLGISVIIDIVYNHMGTVDNDLWDFDGNVPPPGGIWFYTDGRGATPWGSRPDYGRPEVRQYLVDNALSWLEDFRADGLRLDATAWIRSVDGSTDMNQALPDGWLLLQMINDEVDRRQAGKIRIAEDMRNDARITSSTVSGGGGFNSQWDPDFVRVVRNALVPSLDEDRDMDAVSHSVEQRYGSDAFSRIIFTESHDADANGGTRVPAEIDPAEPASVYAKKRSILGAALVFTSPGIPMIFQGQEFLEAHWFDSDFPVDWSNANRYPGILNLYGDLVRLRRNLLNTTRGLQGQGLEIHHVNHADKLIAYRRWADGGPLDETLVLLNFANRAFDSYTIGVPRAGLWRVRLNSDWSGYDSAFGNHLSLDSVAGEMPYDGLPFSIQVGIGTYTALIMSQDG